MDPSQDPQQYECFCGAAFGRSDDLIQHNVQEHEMAQEESARRVMEKYPQG